METLILAIVTAVTALLEGIEGAPSQAQVEAAVRTAMIQASDASMAAEFPGQSG